MSYFIIIKLHSFLCYFREKLTTIMSLGANEEFILMYFIFNERHLKSMLINFLGIVAH